MTTRYLGAAVAVAAAALAVWFFAFRDDGGGDVAAPADTTPATAPGVAGGPAGETEAELDGEASSLESLLAVGRDATFHATYEATAPAETEAGTASAYVVELFRSEGRVRQDTITSLDGGDYLTTGILVDGKSTICTKQGTEEWSCSQSAQPDVGAADGLFGQIVDRLAGVDVIESDEVVDGRDVRCFSYQSADGDGSLCLGDDGIPVRVVSGTTELVLTALEDTVPEDVFTPPVEPVQA